MTDSEGDPQLLASKIRKEIFETTGCTASVGIAGNMLMARLATRTAKPDGQCYIPPERVCFGKIFMLISYVCMSECDNFQVCKAQHFNSFKLFCTYKKEPYHYVVIACLPPPPPLFFPPLFPSIFCSIISFCHESCRLSYV